MTSRRARTLCIAAASAAACFAGVQAGHADTLHGSRSDAVVEKEHRIEIRIDRGHAELVVRRTLHNGGTRHDQATFMIDLPGGAVATGLASLGVKDGQPFWFRGDLMEAEAAAAKYMELTGMGGYYPKDPALLSWRNQDTLALQVFPCAPGQPKTVEYTLRLPTSYREGRHHLALPRVGVDGVPASVVVSAARRGDRLFRDGAPLAPGARFQLTADETDLALSPLPSFAVGGALASSPIVEGPANAESRPTLKGRELVQFHIDAPAKLSAAPQNARVVVILDASRSIRDTDAAAGVAAARAYLGHLGGSQVEVLTFDREVHPRHGRFVPAARAAADLEKLTLARKNGSAFDDALARADALLAQTPSSLPRRILAMTDLLTRSKLTPERLGAVVKSGALVLVGVMEDGAPQLARDDDHDWAPAVRATGGLVWNATASGAPFDDAEMARVYEEWARPIRIEKLEVKAQGIDPSEFGFDVELREGDGLEHRRIHDAAVAEVVLTGELWARPVRKELRPDAEHGRIWSALVFGSELLHELSEPEMMVLAKRGGAVSPVTSYLAIEPGVRPSTEGLDWSGIGEGGGGRGEGIGLGSIGTIGHGSGVSIRDWLKDALSREFGRCPAGPKAATVELETTRDEVVDVTRVALRGGANTAVQKCLEDAVWALDLPGQFSASWATYEVEITR